MTRRTKILLALAVMIAVGQVVPLDRSNPPVEAEIPAPEEVRAVLERACYDCHSNQTTWPWYAWVAPVSWLVVHDVSEAREEMNFSTWDVYDPKEQADHLEEIREEVGEGEMPLWHYALLHPEARLSDAELRLIDGWTRAGD